MTPILMVSPCVHAVGASAPRSIVTMTARPITDRLITDLPWSGLPGVNGKRFDTEPPSRVLIVHFASRVNCQAD
jgi:hypothetical protein